MQIHTDVAKCVGMYANLKQITRINRKCLQMIMNICKVLQMPANVFECL